MKFKKGDLVYRVKIGNYVKKYGEYEITEIIDYTPKNELYVVTSLKNGRIEVKSEKVLELVAIYKSPLYNALREEGEK